MKAFFVALSITATCVAGVAYGQPSKATNPLTRPNDPALIAAAKAEGSVSLYGTPSVVALESDVKGFEEAYGIRPTYLQLVSGPLSARVDQEIKAGRMNADVILTADVAALERWAANGQLAKLPDIKYPLKTDHWAPVQAIYQGFLYNTSIVSDPGVPKSWNDFLNPKFKGRIVLGDPRISPGFSSLYFALLKDSRYGESFFRKLAEQRPRIVQTPVLITQSIASGEALLGFTGLPYEASNIKAKNPSAPIDYAYPDLYVRSSTSLAINAKSSHPNAAKLLALWLLSPAGQTAHNGGNRASSVLGDLPGTLKAPGNPGAQSVDARAVSKEYQSLIDMFDRLYK